MLKICVTNRTTGQKQRYKFVQHAVILGRQPNCDVVLEGTGVSRRHTKVTLNRDLVEIEDLGSGNGTVVNHQKIPAHQKVPVKKTDRIRVEEFEIELEAEVSTNPLDKPANPDVTDPDIIEIKMIKKVLGALDQDKMPSVVVVDDEFAGKKAYFEEGLDELVVGRDENCTLSMDSHVLSRRHAIITVKWGQFVVVDQNSKNGTFVNGRRVEEKSIKDGDEIVFGTIKAVFKNPHEFNMDAITESLQQEKEQKEQKRKISSELQQQEQVSLAAQSSLAGAKEQDTSKKQTDVSPESGLGQSPDKQSRTDRAVEKSALELLGSESFETRKQTPEPVPTVAPARRAKQFLRQYTFSELMLFGFGALVILVIIIVFAVLFL